MNIIDIFIKRKIDTRRMSAIEKMKEIARLTNIESGLPCQIDKYLTAESVHFNEKNKTLVYNFKYTEGYTPSKEELQTIKRNQLELAINIHGKNPYYKYLKVTIQSVYKNHKNKTIIKINIKPEQYLSQSCRDFNLN